MLTRRPGTSRPKGKSCLLCSACQVGEGSRYCLSLSRKVQRLDCEGRLYTPMVAGVSHLLTREPVAMMDHALVGRRIA